MYGILRTAQFDRSFRKLKKSGVFKARVRKDLEAVIDSLARAEALPASCADHQLKGELRGYRECHVKGDILLAYRRVDEKLVLVLVDIRSHSYLFGK